MTDDDGLVARASWPVHTERLTIRRVTQADGATSFAYRSLEEVARWLPSLPTVEAEHVERFTGPDSLACTLMVEHDGRVVGDLMLRQEDPWGQREVAEQVVGTQAELGWVFDPAHGGRGLATEAVAALLDVCFTQLGLRRVIALCFADNTASWRLMERLGMRREQHTVADNLHRDGRWYDGMGYAILADEWAARRS